MFIEGQVDCGMGAKLSDKEALAVLLLEGVASTSPLSPAQVGENVVTLPIISITVISTDIVIFMLIIFVIIIFPSISAAAGENCQSINIVEPHFDKQQGPKAVAEALSNQRKDDSSGES